ncbi:MAG: hypothetical protein HFH24_12125 [Ruminococcus sp.]|nr:hypothetical protein [Ruminococcus sp.]
MKYPDKVCFIGQKAIVRQDTSVCAEYVGYGATDGYGGRKRNPMNGNGKGRIKKCG